MVKCTLTSKSFHPERTHVINTHFCLTKTSDMASDQLKGIKRYNPALFPKGGKPEILVNSTTNLQI